VQPLLHALVVVGRGSGVFLHGALQSNSPSPSLTAASHPMMHISKSVGRGTSASNFLQMLLHTFILSGQKRLDAIVKNGDRTIKSFNILKKILDEKFKKMKICARNVMIS
jgi:hypothetical protein